MNNTSKPLTGQAKGFDDLEAALIKNASIEPAKGEDSSETIVIDNAGDLNTDVVPTSEEALEPDNTTPDNEGDELDGDDVDSVIENEGDEVVDDSKSQEGEEIEDSIIEDWDDSEDTPVEETNTIDRKEIYKDVAKELNVEVEDSDDLNSLVEKIKQKTQDEISSVMDGVPEQLKEAIELSKKGVDFKEFLQINSVDYNSIPDVDLYANAIADHFRDESGSVNEEKLGEYLDGLSDSEIAIRASQLRGNLINAQESAKNDVIRKAEERKIEAEKGISKALDEFDSVSGFKVNLHQKNKIKSSVVNDTLVKDMFYSNGKIDYGKIAKARFVTDNFDKIVGYLRTNSKNEGKRAVVNKMSNVEKRVSGSAPTDNSRKKELSGLELMMSDLKKHYETK